VYPRVVLTCFSSTAQTGQTFQRTVSVYSVLHLGHSDMYSVSCFRISLMLHLKRHISQ
jgi:hypothetical protein